MRVNLLDIFSVIDKITSAGPNVMLRYKSEHGYLVTLKNDIMLKAVVF